MNTTIFQRRGRWGQDPPIADLIDAGGDCWLWLGTRNELGYGNITAIVDGKKRIRKAHRIVWQILVGPIPEGLELDHLCRNPSCVNPDHLEPVTHLENMRRGWVIDHMGDYNRRKTHCKWGHPYDEANTYANGTERVCRTCRTERKRRYRAEGRIK